MLITVSNVLTVENPTEELTHWCKKNLVLINPDYAKKAKMGFWLGNTPKTIALYEIRGDKLILPYGTMKSIPAADAMFLSGFVKQEEIDFQADVPLYDYQREAVDALVKAKFGILQSAAGSGKTQMGIALAARLKRRTLWLCHTLDLVKQSRDRAKLYMPENLMGLISEGKVNLGTGITFATIQTMSKLNLTQYRDYWDVIITDEVHRVSGSPTTVTQYQKVLNSLSARHKYGLSATVHRSDGMIQATYALVGNVAHVVPDSAVADKIMRVTIQPVFTGTGASREMFNTDGTLNYAKLINYLAGDIARNALIAKLIVKNSEKSSLILSDRLEQLETILTLLPIELRRDAVMISGKMTSKKEKAVREQAIEDMRAGMKKYLFATYSLAKEGLDVPRLERLFMATPVKDYAVVAQAIGRIARRSEGKDDPVCYDLADDIGYCVKCYKKRLTTYRKQKCKIEELIEC